jgi:hypothetical protein
LLSPPSPLSLPFLPLSEIMMRLLFEQRKIFRTLPLPEQRGSCRSLSTCT